MNLLEKFKAYIIREKLFHPNDRLLLAVSGGIDSVVLCELCRQAGYNFEIAHCNFQLRGEESNRDEQFVASLSLQYGVHFHVKKFDTSTHALQQKQGVEEAARHLRYQWFYQLMQEMNNPATGVEITNQRLTPLYLLTAHHADDNIETVTMNFFRGTGIKGLRGILPKQDKLIRPLLFARRNELESFVSEHGLRFVTDHTNALNDYARNFFRNIILPKVMESYPAAGNNILNNIQRFSETAELYEQSIALHKNKLITSKGAEVHIPVLKLLNSQPLATILYEIIKDYRFTAHQTQEAIALLHSDSGRYIQSSTHRLLKNRNWLIISPLLAGETAHLVINSNDKLVTFSGGTLQLTWEDGNNVATAGSPLVAQLDMHEIQFPLLLRKWKQGDYFYPLGMQKKKKLSRFFIDQKLSLLQKEQSWVIEMDKKILWVVGQRIDDRFKITANTKQVIKINYTPNLG